jgi:hypothetical protein
VPTNRVVGLALAGAVLTAIVAVGLGAPVGDLAQYDEPAASQPAANGSGQVASGDAPTPNQHFTPAVQSGSEYEDDEDEEYEDDEEENEKEHEEEHEDGDEAEEDEEWE